MHPYLPNNTLKLEGLRNDSVTELQSAAASWATAEPHSDTLSLKGLQWGPDDGQDDMKWTFHREGAWVRGLLSIPPVQSSDSLISHIS